MRLHRLGITAFGPFADTVEVDFDQLGEANLFLLSGDTGAGKTTVLDAVCFALYGDVPGERSTARQLRSHHAGPAVAPRVVLEATVSGRRFRFTRSPSWQRPKKRGSGTTTEQAHVTVEEHLDGAWQLRTNRLDEAGHLVVGLVGMTLSQFGQVVLLPQNQFHQFLAATSEERQKVLTRLFRTERFEQVERWFAERRRALHRQHHGCEAGVRGVLHRISEVAGTPLPESWEESGLAAAVDADEVTAWSARLVAEAETGCVATDEAERSARDRRDEARAAVQHAERTLALRRRHADAQQSLAALAESATAAERDRLRLDAAHRAQRVLPRIELADEAAASADAARDTATRALDRAAAALGIPPDDLDAARLDDEHATATEDLARARAARPQAARRAATDDELAGVRTRTRELEAAIASHEAARDELPAQEDALTAQVRRTREQAALVDSRRVAVERTRTSLEAARRVLTLSVECEQARERHVSAREQAAALREELLSLRERRLTGMAAELASSLAVGAGCPVCGSVEHPSPATADHDAPSRADEDAAQSRLDDAELVVTAAHDHWHGLETQLSSAHAIAGGQTVDALEHRLAEETVALAEAEDAGAQLGDQEAALSAIRARRAEMDTVLQEARRELAICTEAAGRLARLRDEIDADLRQLTGEAPDLETAIGALQQLVETVEAARTARTTAEDRAHRAELTAAEATERCLSEGFEDVAAARGHALDDDVLEALERDLAERDRESAAAGAVLEDPDVVAAVAGPDPGEPATLAEACARAEELLDLAIGAGRSASDRRTALLRRTSELADALAAWAPVRADHRVTAALAELVEGKGAENSRQMRLSAYVLSARLGQVVDAANERLGRMTDSRYLLEHTDRRAAGDRRGGLGLQVLDQWTDERREPGTLSGGETFVVSLALALGLADVVTAEAGGCRIDTLFVDEGFGSLDADTLELVMDTLDQLREGGRVVGVVSHVAEMRNRIPTRLEVVKARHGSTVRTVCGVD